MADSKSDIRTTPTETQPKAAQAPVAAAPAAPKAPIQAPAAEKASQPAPKAEAAQAPAPKAAKAPEPKPAAAATAPKAAPAAAVKVAPARGRGRKAVPVTIDKKPVRKPAAIKSVKAAAIRPATQAARPALKTNEGPRTMTNETTKIADRVQAVFGDVNAKAKEAFERNTKVAEELTELTKGNVEALVASSKLAAKGAETLGQEVAEFGRKSFEDASAALKSFAEVKSPADLFRLQSEFARAQFDAFVSESSKLSESVLKLAGEVAQPITSRYAVAAEKAKAVVAF
jgi:phasin family protein